MSNDGECHFCGSRDDLVVPGIGIAFGMSGDDYSFCRTCLNDRSAMEFWQDLFVSEGFTFPPVLRHSELGPQ